MKAISKMTVYERAICLFNLLPEDISRFVNATKVLSDKIASKEIIVQRNRNVRGKIIDWPQTAVKMRNTIHQYEREINGNATMFAHYLLGNGLEGLTLYSLEEYIALPDIDQSNFYLAAKLLFF